MFYFQWVKDVFQTSSLETTFERSGPCEGSWTKEERIRKKQAAEVREEIEVADGTSHKSRYWEENQGRCPVQVICNTFEQVNVMIHLWLFFKYYIIVVVDSINHFFPGAHFLKCVLSDCIRGSISTKKRLTDFVVVVICFFFKYMHHAAFNPS